MQDRIEDPPVADVTAEPSRQDSAEPPSKRDALFFIPGMGDDWVDQSIQGIGVRLAQALDHEAATARARFPITLDVREEPFGDNLTASVCTITRDDGDGEVPVIDLYKLDSVRTLRAPFESYSLLRKALYPIMFLLLYTRGVVTAFKKREGKTRRERYQVFVAIAVLCLLTFYLLTLVVAAVEIVAPNLVGWLPSEVPQGIVVTLTALGLWKSDIVADLVAGAVGFICVMAYLGHGERRDPLLGQLVALVNYAEEKEGVEYEHMDVVAFSFGTVVALDAFFPRTGSRPARLSRVRSLSTIGCPFDLIRTYWPKYFEASTPLQTPATWLNVYSPIDILASNFRRDGATGEPDTGIPTTAAEPAESRRPVNIRYGEPTSAADMGPLQFITFMGLRSHSIYWGRERESELTAFSPIVSRIYANQPVLS
jgi:hypothetical protein